jgi:hypothetical protein
MKYNLMQIRASANFLFTASQLIRKGSLDYLVLDYLSEVTMSLLVAAQQKNPELGGWCPDFVSSVGPLLPEVKKQGANRYIYI